MIKGSLHRVRELRLRQGFLHGLIYGSKFFKGNRVSGQFRFSLNSLNVDMYLTHPCWTEFLCLIFPCVMNIHFYYYFYYSSCILLIDPPHWVGSWIAIQLSTFCSSHMPELGLPAACPLKVLFWRQWQSRHSFKAQTSKFWVRDELLFPCIIWG